MPDSDAEIKAKLEILRKLSDAETVLEDCPFCGSPAQYRVKMKTSAMTIHCGGDDYSCPGHKCGMVAGKDWQAEIDGWNRRDGR